jgi:hypothetical protein
MTYGVSCPVESHRTHDRHITLFETLSPTEKLLVPLDPALFHFINQGCLEVDGMDDKEEMQLADVSVPPVVTPRALPGCSHSEPHRGLFPLSPSFPCITPL